MEDHLRIEDLNVLLEDFWDAIEEWNYFGLNLHGDETNGSGVYWGVWSRQQGQV